MSRPSSRGYHASVSASLRPEYRVEKRPSLRNEQGMRALVGEHGAVLKRGQELATVLAPLEQRLMKTVED